MGDFPNAVDIVEEGPRELIGRTVFVLHPHQNRFVVPADAVHIVPDGIPPARCGAATAQPDVRGT